MSERKQYKSLDVAKFVSAVLIIILHTAPFGSYSKALTFGFRNIITVVAVPFFFFVSGFLAFGKLNSLEIGKRKEYIKNYLSRIAIMYFIWSAVYFVFVCIKQSDDLFRCVGGGQIVSRSVIENISENEYFVSLFSFKCIYNGLRAIKIAVYIGANQ